MSGRLSVKLIFTGVFLESPGASDVINGQFILSTPNYGRNNFISLGFAYINVHWLNIFIMKISYQEHFT